MLCVTLICYDFNERADRALIYNADKNGRASEAAQSLIYYEHNCRLAKWVF
jgi:hypothetical protein